MFFFYSVVKLVLNIEEFIIFYFFYGCYLYNINYSIRINEVVFFLLFIFRIVFFIV